MKPTRAAGPPGSAQRIRAESAILADCLAALRKRPHCWARKVHGSRYTDRGEPDIDGCLAGRSLKIEVKRPGEKPTAIQYASLRRWARAGALAGWVTSVAELDALLVHSEDYDWQNPALAPDRSD